MRLDPRCYPCFLRQTVIALQAGGCEEDLKHDVVRAVLRDVEASEPDKSPAHATTFIHRTIRRMLGRDPFESIKSEYNKKALALYPALKGLVAESEDPLRTAALISIAGNVIDFGIYTSVDIEGTVARALRDPLAVDRYGAFREEVKRAGEVLFLLDNAGEAVFDRILIEVLAEGGRKVTAVVKGSPVINDCTAGDALEAGIGAGMGDNTEILENGSDAVGTILETTSAEFKERFRGAGLVISKGQANFETLMAEAGNIFFLLQSKCPVLSDFLALPEGSMLFLGGGHEPLPDGYCGPGG
jgi:uncharacterized protein with ATP-grasp and redox domains